jgi:hypothetical protein
MREMGSPPSIGQFIQLFEDGNVLAEDGLATPGKKGRESQSASKSRPAPGKRRGGLEKGLASR